jgi:hypothetical protein
MKSNKNDSILPNLLAVATHLKRLGWKIGKSTIYNHKGRIKKQKDGTYRTADVEKYAAANLERLDGEKADPLEAERIRRSQAETESAVYDARMKKVRTEAAEGKYIAKEIFEEELAVQAQAFRNAIQTYIHSQAEEITNLMGGDVSKIPDLIRVMLDRADEHFFKYADDWQTKGPLIVAVSKTKSKEEEEDDNDGVDESEAGNQILGR